MAAVRVLQRLDVERGGWSGERARTQVVGGVQEVQAPAGSLMLLAYPEFHLRNIPAGPSRFPKADSFSAFRNLEAAYLSSSDNVILRGNTLTPRKQFTRMSMCPRLGTIRNKVYAHTIAQRTTSLSYFFKLLSSHLGVSVAAL